MLLYLISGLLCIGLGNLYIATGHVFTAVLFFICAGLDFNRVANPKFRKPLPWWIFWANVGFLAGNLINGVRYLIIRDACNSTVSFLMVAILALWNAQSVLAGRRIAASKKSE